MVVLIFSSTLDAIYSSSSLIVEARTPILYDVEMKRVEILVLFLILEERLSVFHCWVCTYEVVSWQHGPSVLTMMKIFFMNEWWSLPGIFLCLLRSCAFFHFFLLMWYIILIDLQISRYPCIPVINHLIMVCDPFNMLLDLVCYC